MERIPGRSDICSHRCSHFGRIQQYMAPSFFSPSYFLLFAKTRRATLHFIQHNKFLLVPVHYELQKVGQVLPLPPNFDRYHASRRWTYVGVTHLFCLLLVTVHSASCFLTSLPEPLFLFVHARTNNFWILGALPLFLQWLYRHRNGLLFDVIRNKSLAVFAKAWASAFHADERDFLEGETSHRDNTQWLA